MSKEMTCLYKIGFWCPYISNGCPCETCEYPEDGLP